MELVKDLLLGSLGYLSAAEIGPLTKGVPTKLTKPTLVELPLIRQELST